MRKKYLAITIGLLVFSNISLRADEGMWMLQLLKSLNEGDMQTMGCKLTADQIYSVNNSSLKDAIVMIGRGNCSAEIISKDGLMLTNHHCGFGQIQSHSSVEHDYLTDGFWAMNREDELPNEDLTVSFLVRIEDVTEKVLSSLNDSLDENKRSEAIKKNSDEIVEEATKNKRYNALVKTFYSGNEFYLFVYETYKDVRFVGAPPQSIGKFGGDTDNWMWPRHTGDFSLFRVYMSKDSLPAVYSKDNIPLSPKHFLPVSLEGYDKNDFSMVIGVPGRTQRFMTSFGVTSALELTNPAVIEIREQKLSILKKEMKRNPSVRIKYASKYARSSNYYKYYIGQNKGLKRLHVVDEKRNEEAKLMHWINADAGRKNKYGTIFTDIGQFYKEYTPYAFHSTFFNEAILQGAEIMSFVNQFGWLEKEMEKADAKKEDVDKIKKELKKATENYFKDYNVATDRKLFSAMLKMYYDNVPKNQHPDLLVTIEKKYKGDFEKYADAVFAKTIFTDKQKVNSFINNPSGKVYKKDPAYTAMVSVFRNYQTKYLPEMKKLETTKAVCERLLLQAIREMNPDKKYYPDANSTMRLSYGKVQDYKPMDATYYNYFTTIEGIMEKEDPANSEFVVPKRLRELYEKRDYGRYADKNGDLKVCFITNNDITGGNSGSAVINGRGELIGLAFDGNWEAMSGDIVFDADLKRCINVDIRYVLFIIDKFAGAKNLIDEMVIVR